MVPNHRRTSLPADLPERPCRSSRLPYFNPVSLAATCRNAWSSGSAARTPCGLGVGIARRQNQAIGTDQYMSVVPMRPFTVFGRNLYGGIQAAAFSDVGLAWTDHSQRRTRSTAMA